MGYYVAGYTTVNGSALVAHRDETVYPDAETYMPGHFLGEKGKQF